jgi:hypothetical protein
MHVMDKEQEVETPVAGKGMAFSHLVAITQNGDLNAELTRQLAEVGAALNQHYQDFRGVPKAEISVKFSFKLDKGVVQVLAEKTVKMPKPPAAGELLYIDSQNNFTRDNPQQLHMGFPRTGPRAVP